MPIKMRRKVLALRRVTASLTRRQVRKGEKLVLPA
jgi:hypothetical protein